MCGSAYPPDPTSPSTVMCSAATCVFIVPFKHFIDLSHIQTQLCVHKFFLHILTRTLHPYLGGDYRSQMIVEHIDRTGKPLTPDLQQNLFCFVCFFNSEYQHTRTQEPFQLKKNLCIFLCSLLPVSYTHLTLPTIYSV